VTTKVPLILLIKLDKKIPLKHHMAPNMDIIKSIIIGLKTVSKNNGRIIVRHIMGHQDKTNRILSDAEK
jgi:hypothetical protein